MRTGELTTLLGIDKGTLYNWLEVPELQKYLSAGARSEDNASQRTFTETDLQVLNTVRIMKAQNRRRPWSEIAERLESGELIVDVPTHTAVTDPRTVPLQLAEQSARVMALNEKIEGLLRVIAERDELLIKKEQEAAENVQRLQAGWERERTELREKIAEREAEILRLNDKLLAEIKEVKSGESETWRQMGRMEALNDQLKEEIARLKAESGG